MIRTVNRTFSLPRSREVTRTINALARYYECSRSKAVWLAIRIAHGAMLAARAAGGDDADRDRESIGGQT